MVASGSESLQVAPLRMAPSCCQWHRIIADGYELWETPPSSS